MTFKFEPDNSEEDPGKCKTVDAMRQEQSGIRIDPEIDTYLHVLARAITLLEAANAEILPEVVAERDAIVSTLKGLAADAIVNDPARLAQATAAMRRIVATIEKRTSSIPRNFKTRPPKAFYSSISKLTKELTQISEFNGEKRLLKVSGEKEKQEINVLFAVSLNAGIVCSRPFSPFDRRVNAAVATIYEQECKRRSGEATKEIAITVPQICRALTGRTDTERCSDELQKAVIDSIEKQAQTRIYIDASDEFQRRGYRRDNGKPIDRFRVKSANLLYIDGTIERIGGTYTGQYVVKSEPILHTYSRLSHKIATSDISLLDIKHLDNNGRITLKSVAQSPAHIVIMHYLLDRISQMRYRYEHPRKDRKPITRILFAPIYQEADKDDSKKSQRHAREFVMKCLAFWQARAYISGYEIVQKDRSYVGVDILLSENAFAAKVAARAKS